MMTSTVLVQQSDALRILTLNRPDKLNAFTRTLHGELLAAIRDAEADEACRALVITGAGRGFCAGQDLTERMFEDGVEPDLSENLTEFYNPLVETIRSSRLPVVAAVNGVAAGAGASFALACDVVIAARSAKFVQSFSRIGLVPDAGATWTLPRLIGDARARALFMLGEALSAEQAEAWGMIWKAVEDEHLAEEAQSIAQRLAAVPGRSVALIKQVLAQSATADLTAQLALEAQLQKQAGIHPDFRKSVEAFRKR